MTEKRCIVCKRRLRSRASIELGAGPVCIKLVSPQGAQQRWLEALGQLNFFGPLKEAEVTEEEKPECLITKSF